MKEHQLFEKNIVQLLIVVTVLFNAFGLCFPILRNDDPMLYATIAKHIILTGDWVNLTHPVGIDWLDKPHFPFWITALFFKIFGITSFAYALPGFMFNLIGAIYTFKLGKYLFSRNVGLLSALIYLSSFHLMLSSTSDIRAEAYLLGTIIPACYYWLIYFKDVSFNTRSLLFGAIFTACAIMTKGIFVLVTIGSGVFAILVYPFFNKKNQKDKLNVSDFLLKSSIKIILAILLSFILVAPEIIALYLQFDSHPEKVIYGSNHVSGIKWFFWDSQIGRFFNEGQITRSNVSSSGHYFFFIHTFLWAFLPWSIVFISSVWWYIRKTSNIKKYNRVFLLASFFVTFIMFSLTKFQLDYYTNIIMPFAAIICASWFYRFNSDDVTSNNLILRFQVYLAFILCLLAIACGFYIFRGILFTTILIVGISILIVFVLFSKYSNLTKSIFYPVMAINFIFFFVMLIYGSIYANYDVGYKIAGYLNKEKNHATVLDFRVNSLTLEFYTKDKYIPISDLQQLSKIEKPFYIVAKLADLNDLQKYNKNKLVVVKYFSGTTLDKVMKNIFDKSQLNNSLDDYVVLGFK